MTFNVVRGVVVVAGGDADEPRRAAVSASIGLAKSGEIEVTS